VASVENSDLDDFVDELVLDANCDCEELVWEVSFDKKLAWEVCRDEELCDDDKSDSIDTVVADVDVVSMIDGRIDSLGRVCDVGSLPLSLSLQ